MIFLLLNIGPQKKRPFPKYPQNGTSSLGLDFETAEVKEHNEVYFKSRSRRRTTEKKRLLLLK